MIDVRLLRTDPDGVRAALARRGSSEVLEQLERATDVEVAVRDNQSRRDGLRAEINELSKQVGRKRREGDADGAEALQAQSRALGEQEKAAADELEVIQAELRDLLLRIPNLPHPDAPDGAGEDDNPVIKGPFLPDSFPEYQRIPHWETANALGILDNERATKISGSMFTMQRGAGATLARALCQYALDMNADAFEEIRPPSLVTTATLTATGQLPKFADDAYAIERDDLWCIPTAEVP
ncbi:MAG TPA: serine--tRNA ligase, partial [Ilumatobacteraceae bacterium]|nr:serine--tRNA ligase [Ilumatobacteraceae bacterium]